MRAIDFLEQLQKLDAMINNKLIEKRQWMHIASGVSAVKMGERVQTTPDLHKMESNVCRAISMEAEINECIDRLIDAKMDVMSVIEQLPVVQYNLIHQKYVQYISLGEIADRENRSLSWAKTIHKKSLANVQRILNKRGGDTNG